MPILSSDKPEMTRKLHFAHDWSAPYHRSGWAFACLALRSLESPDGVLFDSIVDKKFSFGTERGDRKNAGTPYTVPWIGILHNPPYTPPWFGRHRSAVDITNSECWRESLPLCCGLYTLSGYLARWLRPRVSVPVCSLYHPTAAPDRLFSFDSYRKSTEASVIHVGWWLRKIHSFYLLRTHQRKILLHSGGSWVQTVIRLVVRDTRGSTDTRTVTLESQP